MANQQQPEIRFGGFIDAWEQRKLGEVVAVCSGRDYQHLLRGDIPVYGTGGYMLSVNEALSYSEDAIGIGRKGTIDKPYILKAPFWTVDTLFYALPKNQNHLEFIYKIFQRINWKQKDESTGVPSLSKSTINSVSIFIPNYEEQTAIGHFFQQLDQAIASHQRKLKQVQQFRQAMLGKMFPAAGKLQPEIRLKGFSGDWVKKRVINFAPLQRGFDLPVTKIKTGDYPVVFSNGILKTHNEYKVEGVGVVTGRSGTIGQVTFVEKNFWPHNTSLWVTNFCDNDPVFVYYFFKKMNLSRFATGSGVPTLNRNDVHDQTILIPQKNEQIAIGHFFQQLDKVLTAQTQHIATLRQLKTAFLAKMFV